MSKAYEGTNNVTGKETDYRTRRKQNPENEVTVCGCVNNSAQQDGGFWKNSEKYKKDPNLNSRTIK